MRYGQMFVVATVVLTACVPPFLPHMEPVKAVRGTITKIEEVWDYEPQCGMLNVTPQERDCHAINEQAWRATLTDSLGKKSTFVFFTANGAPGVPPQEGWTGTFTLHATPVFKLLTCNNPYQINHCEYSMDYTLDSERDVAP
jgi:hypothetical protein